MSSPKRFEWVKMNLDTGAAESTFPLNSGPDGLCRSLTGRLTAAHKVLCSAGEIACKGRQDSYLGSDGGFMIPVNRKIGHAVRMYFERLVNWHGTSSRKI